MEENKKLEFMKVYHERLGKDVTLSYDILDIISDEFIKDIICEFCNCKTNQNKIIEIKNKKLGYEKICKRCWENSMINWSDNYY